MWASTLCPLSSSTRNMALGRGSTTVPSTSIASFFATLLPGFSRQAKLAPTTAEHDRNYRPAPQERLQPAVPRSQHFRTVFGHGDRVLEVGRELAVRRDHRPLVGQDPGPPATHVDHGLDGHNQPGLKDRSPPRGAEVRDLGVLVEGPAHP